MRRILDFDQVEAFGRRGRAAGSAIAGRERARHIVGMPPSEANQLQCTGHVAHLVVQERAGARCDMDFVAGPVDFQRVERLQRRPRLAKRVAEGRKIVVPDEVTGAGAHRVGVERRGDLQTRPRSSAGGARRFRMR